MALLKIFYQVDEDLIKKRLLLERKAVPPTSPLIYNLTVRSTKIVIFFSVSVSINKVRLRVCRSDSHLSVSVSTTSVSKCLCQYPST